MFMLNYYELYLKSKDTFQYRAMLVDTENLCPSLFDSLHL